MPFLTKEEVEKGVEISEAYGVFGILIPYDEIVAIEISEKQKTFFLDLLSRELSPMNLVIASRPPRFKSDEDCYIEFKKQIHEHYLNSADLAKAGLTNVNDEVFFQKFDRHRLAEIRHDIELGIDVSGIMDAKISDKEFKLNSAIAQIDNIRANINEKEYVENSKFSEALDNLYEYISIIIEKNRDVKRPPSYQNHYNEDGDFNGLDDFASKKTKEEFESCFPDL